MADDGRQTLSENLAPALGPGQRRGDNPLLGIVLILIGLSFIPLMDGIAKLLGKEINPIQLVWLRYGVQLLICLPIAALCYPRQLLRPAAPGLQLLRGLLGLGAAGFFFQSVTTLPLADALAVSFVYPFIITALSPLVLGERVGPWRWAAVMLGFVGVLIIIQPGVTDLSPGIMFALAAGTCYATIILITRRVAGTDPAVVTLTLTALTAFLAVAALQPGVWQWPTQNQWLLVIAAGITGTFCQLLIIFAHEKATASSLAPFAYVEVISAVFLGWLLFGDWPVLTTWIGIAVVVAAGLVIAWREAVRRSPAPAKNRS